MRIVQTSFFALLFTVTHALATLPSPWVDANIGGDSGSASADANGVFTVIGNSSGTPTSDALHFAYQTVTGDFVLIARLASFTPYVAGTGLAGLMIRESTNADSREVFVLASDPDANTTSSQVRLWNGDPFHLGQGGIPFFDDPNRPVPYQKIVRYKDQITVYESPDPNAGWTPNNGYTLPNLASQIDVGFYASSQWNIPTRTATATFDNVSITSLTLPYHTSWFGNTWGGGSASVLNNVNSIAVDANTGTLITNSFWDESGKEGSIYKTDGTFYGSLDGTHGWFKGGFAVATDGNYVYFGTEQDHDPCYGADPNSTTTCPPDGSNWFGVRRFDLHGTSKGFAGGFGFDLSTLSMNGDVPAGTDRSIHGLAVKNGKLYASDTYGNRILLYDTSSMTLSSSFSLSSPVANPRGIAVEADANYVRVIADDVTNPNAPVAKVFRYKINGTKQSQTITGASVPTAVAIDSKGSIFVADSGVDNQIKKFNSNGSQTGTFGTQFGIYSTSGAGKGVVQPLRFNGPRAIAFDGGGNFYVASDPGTGPEIRKFSGAGNSAQFLWERDGLEFVAAGDFDPSTDGQDVYTKESHYTMNYSDPNHAAWTYTGLTLDMFKYPDDLRLHTSATGNTGGIMVRRYNGARFTFVTMQDGRYLGVYRFKPSDPNFGETAIPCGLFATVPNPSIRAWPSTQPDPNADPNFNRWIWIDKNGDGQMRANGAPSDANNEYIADYPPRDYSFGWYVDSNLDVWQTSDETPGLGNPPDVGIRRYKLVNIDAHGTPVYATDAAHRFDYLSTTFDPNGLGADPNHNFVERAYYVPSTDTMFVGAYTTAHPPSGQEFGYAGREVRRYRNWLAHLDANSPADFDPAKDVISDAPYIGFDPATLWWCGATQGIKSMTVTADRIYLAETCTREVRVYDSTATTLGAPVKLLRPGPEAAGVSGIFDIPVALNAFKRANGVYLIAVEEDYEAKGILYHY